MASDEDSAGEPTTVVDDSSHEKSELLGSEGDEDGDAVAAADADCERWWPAGQKDKTKLLLNTFAGVEAGLLNVLEAVLTPFCWITLALA